MNRKVVGVAIVLGIVLAVVLAVFPSRKTTVNNNPTNLNNPQNAGTDTNTAAQNSAGLSVQLVASKNTIKTSTKDEKEPDKTVLKFTYTNNTKEDLKDVRILLQIGGKPRGFGFAPFPGTTLDRSEARKNIKAGQVFIGPDVKAGASATAQTYFMMREAGTSNLTAEIVVNGETARSETVSITAN